MFRSLQRPQSLVDAKVFVVLLHIERVTFGVGGEDFARAHAGLDGLFDAFKHARRYAPGWELSTVRTGRLKTSARICM